MSVDLPKDGADVGPELVGRVRPFVDAGLVRLEPFDVIYCADVEEGDDWDCACDGWMSPGRSDELECDRCDRLLWFEPGHIRQRFRARIDREGIEAWLEERLRREGSTERLRSGCAWRVVMGGEEITVAVLDWSETSRWVRADRMAADPTVLVLVEPARYRTNLRDGVVAVDLEELVLGQDLTTSWAEVCNTQIAFTRPVAWLPSHTLPNRYYSRRLGAHRVDAVDGQLRVDGVFVERAGGAYPMVRLLVSRHLEDTLAEKTADAHCWWPAQELADELSREERVTRAQVKRALGRFVAEARQVYRAQTGLELASDAVIESSRLGYRLNPTAYGRLA